MNHGGCSSGRRASRGQKMELGNGVSKSHSPSPTKPRAHRGGGGGGGVMYFTGFGFRVLDL